MTVSLLNVLKSYYNSRMAEVHTAIPARILDYDPATQKASVQPLIKRRYYDADRNPDGLVDQPAIVAVPVVFPSAASGSLSFPISKGDIVLLVFSEVSIDSFVFSDGDATVDPQDTRVFDYSDAIAIPGLYPFKKALGSHPTDVVLKFNVDTANENSIRLKPNGDVQVDTPTNYIVNAGGNIQLNATGNVDIQAGGTLDAVATGVVTIDGSTINIG